MAIVQADSTVAAIRKKIRRLTTSASESALTTNDIDQAINTFYNNDFPYAIKLDQMRNDYTFFTSPNIDRYPLNVNYNQGIRAPVYFEGIQGYFFKDRQQFYNMWPRWPTLFTPASGDGVTQTFTFTIPGPFLSQEVTIGTQDVNGAQINVTDLDGQGLLFVSQANAQISVPSQIQLDLANQTIPGMRNENTGNPGDQKYILVGSVNYVTGVMAIDYGLAGLTPAQGSQINVWVSQYQVGRPYTMLLWNNEFQIRPVPDKTYKVEVESYLTPVQFMETTDVPILTQWWQYIAYGASMEILRERQDFDGVEGLREGFDRQEALVLERQGIEEIDQRNGTIYSSTQQQQGWNQGQGWPY